MHFDVAASSSLNKLKPKASAGGVCTIDSVMNCAYLFSIHYVARRDSWRVKYHFLIRTIRRIILWTRYISLLGHFKFSPRKCRCVYMHSRKEFSEKCVTFWKRGCKSSVVKILFVKISARCKLGWKSDETVKNIQLRGILWTICLIRVENALSTKYVQFVKRYARYILCKTFSSSTINMLFKLNNVLSIFELVQINIPLAAI